MKLKSFFSRLFIAGIAICIPTVLPRAATLTYSYDSLNRLTNASYSDGALESYSYDDAGNRLTRILTTLPDTTAPSIPTNINISTNTHDEITLRWSKSTDIGSAGMAGYILNLNGVFFTNSVATNVVLSGLVPNAAYCASLASFDNATNISTFSSAFCFQVPAVNLSANPALSVNIFPFPSPSTQSPNWNAFKSNALSFLQTGQNLSSDRQSSANFTLSSSIEPGDIILSTTNTALWRGELNPMPPFQEERGGHLRFALHVVSQIAFNLDGVSWDYGASDSNDAFRYLSRLTNVNYQFNIQGLWYGPDGIKNTIDDVLRTAGSGTNLINELYYIGPGSSRVANDQIQLDAEKVYINANLPLIFRCTFELFNTNGLLIASTFKKESTTSLPDKRIKVLATNNGLDFGAVILGDTSTRFLVVSNAGTTLLNLQGVEFPFGFSSALQSITLAAGETTNIAVTFSPKINISYGGRFSVASDGASGSDSVPLYASVISPAGAPTINLEVFATPAPSLISSNFPLWRANVRRFLHKNYPLPTTQALPQNFALPMKFDAGAIMTTGLTNVTLWRGHLNPASPFADEHGVWTIFALRVVSATPFNATGVSWFIDCSVPGVMRNVGTNSFYGTGLIGLWYGADGIKGTLDDIWRISDSSVSDQINEIIYIGAGSSFRARDSSQIEEVTNYVATHSPFSMYCIYTVRDTNGVILATNTTSVLISSSLPESNPYLRLGGSNLSTDGVELQFSGMAGVVYEVQASTNFINWQPIGTSFSSSDDFIFVDPPSTNFNERFYRLIHDGS